MSAYKSTGIQVSFSGFSGEILDVNPGGFECETLDTTHQQSTNNWRTFMAGLKDAGEITITVHFKSGSVPAVGTDGALAINWGAAAGGGSISCNAILKKSMQVSGGHGQKLIETVTFKLSGEPT